MSKGRLIISSVICVFVVVLLSVIFNAYDLEISKTLTKINGPFFEFFDDFGELPIYLGPILFGSIYCFLCKRWICKFGLVSFTSLVYLVAVYKVFHNMGIDLSISSISLIISIASILA